MSLDRFPRLLTFRSITKPWFAVFAAIFLSICSTAAVSAQRADHLTDEEIELIRDVQEVDYRMEIYTRAIERRIIAIRGKETLDKDGLKRLEKESEKWGELPEGTFTQLLADVPRILDEAVNKIEDVAERDEKSELFPFAVYILADYCVELTSTLEGLRGKAKTPRDTALINDSIGQCADISEASSKVTRPDPKARKKIKRETLN